MPKVLGVEDGTVSADFNLEKRGELYVPRKTWEIRYLVLADNTSQSEETILSAPGLPPLWSVLGGGVCRNLRVKEKSTVFRHPETGVKTVLYTVGASFDSRVDTAQNQPPIAKTPTVRWSGETEEEVLEKDPITGEPVQTKAEEPIIITTPIVLPVLEITRYEAYPFDPDVMLAYSHHTNSEIFWGAPSGSALMLPMEVDEEVIEQVRYCRVTYRIKFKIKKEGANMLEDTWKARVLHHGFKYRPSNGAEPVIYRDKNGSPATVNLKNGNPGVIDSSNPAGTKVPSGDPAEYLEFNRFTKVNFNNLSLGPF